MPLTDREWWLVRHTYATTLRALISACDVSGVPGKVAAQVLLGQENSADLRRATEIALTRYKPDAG